MDTVLREVGNVAFLLCGLGAISFCVLYSLMAKWWKSQGGRFIFTFMAVIALILVFAMIRLIFGPYPGMIFVRPITYLSLATTVWWLVGIMVAQQIKGSRSRAKHNEESKNDQSH